MKLIQSGDLHVYIGVNCLLSEIYFVKERSKDTRVRSLISLSSSSSESHGPTSPTALAGFEYMFSVATVLVTNTLFVASDLVRKLTASGKVASLKQFVGGKTTKVLLVMKPPMD